MAVVQGNPALASEFNTLRGEVNEWFADNYAGSISFGNANQTKGWAGSAAAAVAQGDIITAAQLNTLIDRCNLGTSMVNNVTGALPQAVAGAIFLADDFNDTEDKSDLISTNRLDVDAGEMSLVAGGNSVRTTTWSAAVDCTFRYTLSDFDEARYFFNSGGAFNISATITGYSTGTGWDGAGFNEIFTNMGTILMDQTETTQSGTGGTPTSIGYYDLTASFQTIFSQTGSGAYSDATLLIEARYGSSGAWIEVKVTLTPGSGRQVNGTTTVTTQYRKLDNQSSGGASLTITAPSYSLIDGLE